MKELTYDKIRDWLSIEEEEFYLEKFREKHGISGESSTLYVAINRMVEEKELRRIGRGLYKKVKKVTPVALFSVKRDRKPPFDLNFPIDYDTRMPFEFAADIVIREGDIVSIGGVSNFGKTALALNFAGENADYFPILMGNEYTSIDNDPTPRLLNRLDSMDWVEWLDSEGGDKITLLPVREDYAEHIVKDRINIIDWINLDGNQLFNISGVMQDVKANLGKGIAILVLQKGEGTNAPRGGQFAKDFTDCELLIDKFSDSESLLTIGKVKESTKPVVGKTYAFALSKGIRIICFREIIKCPNCHGSGYVKSIKCDRCSGKKYVDK